MKSFTLAAVGFAMAAAAPVIAGPTVETVDIDTSGIDLASVEGQKIVERRIDRAARKVCDMDKSRTGTRIPSSEASACYAKARASAMQQMATLVDEKRLGG